jgi:hypothetical protein
MVMATQRWPRMVPMRRAAMDLIGIRAAPRPPDDLHPDLPRSQAHSLINIRLLGPLFITSRVSRHVTRVQPGSSSSGNRLAVAARRRRPWATTPGKRCIVRPDQPDRDQRRLIPG